ncbi:energy-coupling factor ABC transporter ATP-binding protein [Ligilactobacillus sp. WILCCON 0076]|uniref:Energy-coupling factor ABC transporter ATP-binding protein n=1 Tax=Ligilactobacillus ubinensis TaxID=2876789 RepID=A0A9X2FJE4_9LACO|nr:energy-coupling factor ABC transporter ATP-binding protein [Ligilactobacillus ubinensis]MCP0886879.1 energy-coupling factor ABC transporter ATP-binding protein [Ligilactobacillus ubinensis]
MSAIIEIENLTYRYAPDDIIPALDNINLSIKEGQWLAIVGHNGSGKSTLAKAIDGLIAPQEGTIKVAGIKLSEDTVWDIRTNIGMVFQNPDNQFVGADVEGDVAFGMENQGIERSEMVKRVHEALTAVNMSQFAKHEPVRLSGGQKQRVAIAGVLALRPNIVIFDESTSMLDPEGHRDIIKLMKKLNTEEKFTVLSITHDIDEAALADRVVVLDNGKIIADDSPEKIFARGQQLIDLGLDVPYPESLKQELAQLDVVVPKEYLSEEGMIDWLCRLLLKN